MRCAKFSLGARPPLTGFVGARRVGRNDRREAEASRILPQQAFNPIRNADTCVVCLGSRDGFEPMCNSCRDNESSGGGMLADVVVPLTYAGEMNAQLRRDLRNYKDGYGIDVRADALYRLSALAWSFFHHHARCLDAIGGPVTDFVTVPSGKPGGRADGHPLEGLAKFAPSHWNRLEAVRIREARSRSLDSKSLELAYDYDLAGRHVVVFDDTWTSGAKSQSVAKVLRKAGAAFVSIVVVARILRIGWAPTAALLEKYPKTPWSGSICPVTGGQCP